MSLQVVGELSDSSDQLVHTLGVGTSHDNPRSGALIGLHGHRDRAMLLLGFAGGMRRRVVAPLEVADLEEPSTASG